MAKFRIWVQQVSYLYADVEADSFDEAADVYDGLYAGDFAEDIHSCSRELSHITDENDRVILYL